MLHRVKEMALEHHAAKPKVVQSSSAWDGGVCWKGGVGGVGDLEARAVTVCVGKVASEVSAIEQRAVHLEAQHMDNEVNAILGE